MGDNFTETFPYADRRFDQFVKESYSYNNSKEWHKFYDQMDNAYNKYRSRFPGWDSRDLNGMLDSKRDKLSRITDASKRTAFERSFSADLHRFVKKAIPTFSLDRGFEFYYTQQRGERQCFLQSVLIAGMLQRAGVNAGIAMVYKNLKGVETNNGHAVDLVRLSNGHDIIVDASEQKPFAKQRGLFIKQSTYVYADPVYEGKTDEILRYISAFNKKAISIKKVNALDYDFIRSQFWYYRGERTPGSLILLPKTATGLKRSEQALRTSIKICPENPLAVFTLGRVYMANGKMQQAKRVILDAHRLYLRFGWTPSGINEYLALVGKQHTG